MSKQLTLEIAQKYLQVDTGDLESILRGDLATFTSIDDDAAQALAKHEGEFQFLYLKGLTSLSEAAAQALAKHEGWLCLDGLTSLSEAAAQALAKHEDAPGTVDALGIGLGSLILAGKIKRKVNRYRTRQLKRTDVF